MNKKTTSLLGDGEIIIKVPPDLVREWQSGIAAEHIPECIVGGGFLSNLLRVYYKRKAIYRFSKLWPELAEIFPVMKEANRQNRRSIYTDGFVRILAKEKTK